MKITLLTLSLLFLATSCLDSGGRAGRPLIEKLGATAEAGPCTAFFNVTDGSCDNSCPVNTHEANDTELADAIDEVKTTTILDDTTRETYLNNIGSSSKVCVAGSGVLRPDEDITIKGDYCICLNGKSDTVKDCANFCSNKNDSSSTLYGSVDLGPSVLLNSQLGSLYNWCNVEITGSDFKGPGCFLEVTDSNFNVQLLPVTIPSGSNTFSVNLSTLSYEEPFVADIIESQSGSNARTKKFQIYKKAADTGTSPVVGPLKIMPISQYTCVTRSGSTDTTGDIFLNAARLHFYFSSNAEPQAMPPGDNFLICHDTMLHPGNDSPAYPRLELIPAHYTLWDQSDIRFVDLDGDGSPDINKTIQNRLLNDFGQTSTINIFQLLSWPNRPGLEGTPPNLGFYMQPWIDENNGRGFCPTQEHYNGTNPIFKVLKEYIGVDTEAIYLAEREPVAIVDETGTETAAPQDVLFIRENLLKKIWFYYENNQHLVPDSITANTKTIRFYWPADVDDPYVRKSTQKVYTIRYPDQIGKDGAGTGLQTTIRPPDKRFGCAPALTQ